MKDKLIPSIIIISFITVFLIFYKGLQETNIYTPNSEIKKDILDTKKRLNDLYVKHCGKDLKTVEDAMERDNYMNPDQALEFGLIDKIVESR